MPARYSRPRETFRYNPIDFEKDIAIGLTLPLTNDSTAAYKYDEAPGVTASLTDDQGLHDSDKSATQGDFHLSYTTLEQAKSNLRNLVLTNRGERVMHPEFGCDIWASLFNNITPQLLNAIKDNIYRQVSIWLSYINLLDVRVQQTKENENRVNIKLTYALYDDSINKETITINNVGNL
jgi:phage baseplate assembly protein W|tara:strand:- start:46 stop:582 length:537 start_codon:yes stop_codon:yes gene_type:complete